MLVKLGLLVGVLSQMILDVSIFIVIYFVILVACTMLFIGVVNPEVLNPQCKVGQDFGQVGPIQCQVCTRERERARGSIYRCARCSLHS
jgi:hypothetical protein